MRTLTRAPLVTALAMCTSLAGLAASDEAETAKAWETVLDLRVNDGVLTLHLERNPGFELPDDWVSLRSFSKSLPEMFRDRLVPRDGWGSDFLVRSFYGQLIVVSGGPDGDPETVEQLSAAEEDGEGGLSFGGPDNDDIVLLVGERVVNGPKTSSELLMTAMADLRTLGTAIESYAIDNNSYPPQSKGLQTVDFISSMLSPVYLRDVPVEDPWGNEFLYWSDQADYIIVSAGADGILNRPYSIEPGWLARQKFSGEYVDPGEDMVFSNGQFVQWPRRSGP